MNTPEENVRSFLSIRCNCNGDDYLCEACRALEDFHLLLHNRPERKHKILLCFIGVEAGTPNVPIPAPLAVGQKFVWTCNAFKSIPTFSEWIVQDVAHILATDHGEEAYMETQVFAKMLFRKVEP